MKQIQREQRSSKSYMIFLIRIQCRKSKFWTIYDFSIHIWSESNVNSQVLNHIWFSWSIYEANPIKKIKYITIYEFLDPYMAQQCHIWKWVYIIYECSYSYMKTTHSIYGTYLHICYIYVTYMFLFSWGSPSNDYKDSPRINKDFTVLD